MLRGKAPRTAEDGEGSRVLKLSERQIAWKEISRVQLWPEKCIILFYAPAWWLRIPVVCTPFTWEDVMEYIREKLGRKKNVRLPESLTRQAPAARAGKRDSLVPQEPETFRTEEEGTYAFGAPEQEEEP